MTKAIPDAATRVCGVVGHPVSHSLSPAIHNAALRHDGVNAVYLAFDVDELPPAIAGLRSLGAVGVNVTVPHKTAAAELADERDDDVARTGAANVLLLHEHGIRAHNTDVHGFDRALRELAGDPSGRRCLLLGAGGAAHAAALVLARAGAVLLIANRTRARAVELAAACDASVVDDVDDVAGSIDLIVNATSVGLGDDAMPISKGALQRAGDGGCSAVLDIVYRRDETELVRCARSAGIPAADGLSMLVHQAAAAYELFWERPAPLEVMRRAAGR